MMYWLFSFTCTSCEKKLPAEFHPLPAEFRPLPAEFRPLPAEFRPNPIMYSISPKRNLHHMMWGSGILPQKKPASYDVGCVENGILPQNPKN